jgi:hypothetical protein
VPNWCALALKKNHRRLARSFFAPRTQAGSKPNRLAISKPHRRSIVSWRSERTHDGESTTGCGNTDSDKWRRLPACGGSSLQRKESHRLKRPWKKSLMAIILSPPAPACRQAGQAGEAKNLLSLKRKNKADSLPAGRRARANSALGMTDPVFPAAAEACATRHLEVQNSLDFIARQRSIVTFRSRQATQ